MGKAPDAFRTISEVAEWLDVAPHVLRFWESKFTQVKPVKRAGGRRYYRPADMELLGGIKMLLHDQGQTIKAVQSMIREDGISAVTAHSPMIDGADDIVHEATPETAEDDNVVAFEPTVAPEPAAATEPATPPAPGPAPEPEPQEAAPEPAPAVQDPAPEPTAPKPRIVEIADIPDDTPGDAPHAASAIGLALSRTPAELASKADQIIPLLTRLKALRAQMTDHGVRG
ncbi:MerR family transcriptional regulator [Cognatishimia sp. MH4019]|uniref:MerR family transcriptional regulator n=1 Tax=Cognatishimia sp. MH4019 TaxID=2854030 RepID=UPI001CD78EC2|nr:MerR family transcriptional regulator [Cognatishimia sp. MH4019]